jgi:hypothetical protein
MQGLSSPAYKSLAEINLTLILPKSKIPLFLPSLITVASAFVETSAEKLAKEVGYGCVAQLNRASDYGSEGYRFESYRGHTVQ